MLAQRVASSTAAEVAVSTVMTGNRALANDAWEALLSAHAVLLKQFAADDIFADITIREYDVLYTLSKCPDPLRIGELNRHVLLSQPALSRLVDRLASRGLVERRPDPADRRGVRLSLTSTGRALQRQIGRRHARSVARALTAVLGPDEIRQLEIICGKLARQPAAARGSGGRQGGAGGPVSADTDVNTPEEAHEHP